MTRPIIFLPVFSNHFHRTAFLSDAAANIIPRPQFFSYIIYVSAAWHLLSVVLLLLTSAPRSLQYANISHSFLDNNCLRFCFITPHNYVSHPSRVTRDSGVLQIYYMFLSAARFHRSKLISVIISASICMVITWLMTYIPRHEIEFN